MFNKLPKRQIETLLNCFKDFEVTDLVGFGAILGVEEKEDFTDYCVDIIAAFCEEKRLKRKQLLKLAKDIQIANHCMVPADKEKKTEVDVDGTGA